MKVWDDMLNKNPKWKGKPIVSIVFEDNGNTFTEDCLFSLGYRKRPIKVQEYVYESTQLGKRDINLIVQSIINLSKSNNYIDQTEKCKFYNRGSICPDFNNTEVEKDSLPRKGEYDGVDYIPENKAYKYHKNIGKNKITESQIHNAIKESVNQILSETSYYPDYNKENGLQRLACENQDMESKVKEVARFANLVANIAESEGRENYVPFYRHFAPDILEMANLWGFLDFPERE